MLKLTNGGKIAADSLFFKTFNIEMVLTALADIHKYLISKRLCNEWSALRKCVLENIKGNFIFILVFMK